ECKVRRTGFTKLYAWLGEHRFLGIKQDRLEPLVVMRASDLASLLAHQSPPETMIKKEMEANINRSWPSQNEVTRPRTAPLQSPLIASPLNTPATKQE